MQKKQTHHYQYTKTKEKRKKKIIITLIIITLIIGTTTIFIKNKNKTAKNLKIGNNSSSQEIVDYILNISSYETQIEVEVKSNKNSNKYKMKQKYIDNQNNTQEVLEPSNIQGVKIIKEGNTLRIIENYQEITQNNMDLANFIENYKNNTNSKFKEENNQIIMETTAKTENNYQKYEKLYVSKENGKPTKMEIKDTNQNTIIYIIYNEININQVANQKIYAFKLFGTPKEI